MSDSGSISLNSDMKSTLKILLPSAAFLYCVVELSKYLSTEYALADVPVLGPIVSFLASYGSTVVISILLFCLCVYIVGASFNWFWHKYVHPPLDGYKRVIVNEIAKNKESLEKSLNIFRQESEELLKDNLLESVVVRSDSVYLEKNLRLIHEKAYGSHCSSDNGLHAEIRKELYPFLKADKPHRSQHNQSITVVEKDGKVLWEERTSFEIHVVALDKEYTLPSGTTPDLLVDDKDGNSVEYTLKSGTSGQFVNLKDMFLQIKIEDEPVANLQDMIEIDETTKAAKVLQPHIESLKIETSPSGFINFEFSIKLKLKSAMTRVQIVEKSFLDDNDNFYVVRRVEPSYGAVISITLPENWNILSFTVPNEKKWGYPNSILANSSHCRHVIADINSWVLPGIIASCTWERKLPAKNTKTT
jgi:hypothetical protein